MITNKQILNAIDRLGLENQSVCIHTSMRSFADQLESGAEGLLQSFLKKGCTVMVPAFSDMYEANPVAPYMPEQNGAGDYSYFLNQQYQDKIYDTASRKVTVEEMGIFPKVVLQTTGCVRGGNPLNSFAAVGEQAARLVKTQTARDVYAPIQQLYEDDGWVLLMGVGLDSATAIHYAEQIAGRKPFIRWAKNSRGKTVPVSAGGCSDGFPRMDALLRPLEKTVQVGESLWRCFRVRQLVDQCVKIIREQPQLTHCGDPDCGRCNDALLGGPILPEDFWEM